MPTVTTGASLTATAVSGAGTVETVTVATGTSLTATAVDGAGTVIAPTITIPVVYELEGFRWRNDNGNEAAATPAADQDVSVSLPTGQTKRLRVLVDTLGTPATPVFTLQYKLTTDSEWSTVTV